MSRLLTDALASLGLAYPPPVIAGLGDSITAQNTINDGTTFAYNAKGDIAWLCALMRGRLKFPLGNNFGVSGETSTQILARVGDVVAARPGYCRVLAGTNDMTPGNVNPAVVWTNLQTIYETLLAAGIIVIACPILPRSYQGSLSSQELTNAQRGFQWINRRIRNYARTKNNGSILVADYDIAVQDMAQTTYIPLAGYTSDGLHPVAAGAYQMGAGLFSLLDPIIPKLNTASLGQQNVYDAVYNPLGNMIPSGEMLGTGGTAGTGASGQVASSWSISRTTGSTVTATCVKETEDARTGAVRQVITLGGASGASTEVISMTRNITTGNGFAAGDVLAASVEIEGVNLSRVRNIALRVSDDGSVQHKHYGLNSSGNTGDRFPATLPKALVRTPDFTVQSGVTTLTIAIEITVEGTSAPSGDVKIGHAAIYKVE